MKKRAGSGVSLLVVRSAEVRKTYRAWFLSISLAALLLCSVPLLSAVGVAASTAAGAKGASSRHNNNWAVLVCTSRFWFNYRHVANTLSVYHTVRRLGIPDSNIVLMLADDMPCNARNPFPGGVYNSKDHELNLYEGDVEVDYRVGVCVKGSSFSSLQGRSLVHVVVDLASSTNLGTSLHDAVYVFDPPVGVTQFHDMEEVSSHDLGGALREMELKKRYHRVLFMVDTCQAMTLFEEIDSKDVICIGSSVRGENSYARGSDATIGLSLMDRFTSAMLDFFQAAITKGEDVTANRVRGFSSGNSAPLNLRDDVTLGALMHSMRPKSLLSSPTVELKGWTGPSLN
ncbi:unnamed protein product, partial [Ectocarpus sp. 13 AM-2016]